MNRQHKNRLRVSAALGAAVLVAVSLSGCLPSAEDLQSIDYTPIVGGDWAVSTPEAQGLDPMLVATLYYNAPG